MITNKIIIAIDGHSSTGKSTFAKEIAAKYGYMYIDSGAIYRAITFFAIQSKAIQGDSIDEASLQRALPEVSVSFSSSSPNSLPLSRPASDIFSPKKSPPSDTRVWLNGVDVSREIRLFSVSEMVSYVSALPFVRAFVDQLLQKWGAQKGIVMDGRDIGTQVFPHAELKIFMTASPDIRAKRRYHELLEKGEHPNYQEILDNIQKRDYLDQHRSHAPLRCAPDALLLDNSLLSPHEQMQWLQKIILERWG